MNGRNFPFFKVLTMLLMLAGMPLLAQENLIPNGSFLQAAGTGYSSDYQFSWGLGGDNDVGKYCQCKNANICSTSMFSFYDHTSGDGQGDYLVANGATNANMRVWYATVNNLQQYSYYDFSLWVTNLSYGGGSMNYMRSKLKVKFNYVTMVDNYVMPNVSTSQGIWNQMPTVRWYSGSSTSVLIEIFDNCTQTNGNDFGLDDITLFYQYTNVVQANDDEVTTCFETPININPMANDVVTPSSLVPDVTFQVLTNPTNGNLQLVSGTTYRYTPNTGFSGTDSFSYRLRYGTGSDAITSYGLVDITVNPRPQRTINVDACESYTWSYTGQTYFQSGPYTYIKTSPNACDSLLILNLTIHHNEQQTLSPVVECDEYTWHGTTYTQSGTYEYITTTQWGCQLTQYLPLTINHSDTLDIPVSACEQYTWYGQTYSNSGTYTHMTTNSFGCQRMERLILTISDRFRHVDNLTECDSYYWPRTQQWYYQSTIDSTTVEGPPGGCDSTFVLNLTLHYADTLDLEPVEACDSYEWHGQTYTTSGIKTYQTTNEFGCDRLERLNLTIHNSEIIPLPDITVCDEYPWHGQTYTQSGSVTFDTVNQYGCNLQYVLPLTINHSDTLDWEPVTECDSYLWYGQTITESGSYSHTSTNPDGCDRLERIFVTINYSTIDTLEPVIACDSYDWHGENYTRSGLYSYETEGSTGCPYTEVLRLTINHSTQYEFNQTSCEPYEWFGTVYDEPGIYYHELTNGNIVGCDSLLIMHLDIGETYTMEENVVGCDEYEWYGNVYTQGGEYQHEVINPDGCDSLFIIHLTIAPTYVKEIEDEACYSYTWIDQIYTQSGDYERHFSSVAACDSLVILHLTIKEAMTHEFEQQTCLPFTWNGITYYENGDYEQTFEASNGCDSIATMHLVFREALTSDFDRSSCVPIQWYENYCDHNDDYYHTFQSVQGCDSIVTMHFSLTETLEHEFDTVACETFDWYDYPSVTNGTYTQHFTTPQGCDSIVTMRLQLNVTQMNTQFVPACDSALIQGIWYNEPGDYYIYLDTLQSQNGCDSIIHRINLTVRNSEEMAQIEGVHNVYVASNLISGIYRYAIDTAGIVSGIEWSLTNPEWIILDHDSVSCRVMVTTPGSGLLKANFLVAECGEMERQFPISAGFFGVDDHQSVEAHIYPNPTKGMATVEAFGIEQIRVVNMIGQTLEVIEGLNQDQVPVNLSHYGPSVYLIEIKTVNGMAKKRVVVCR